MVRRAVLSLAGACGWTGYERSHQTDELPRSLIHETLLIPWKQHILRLDFPATRQISKSLLESTEIGNEWNCLARFVSRIGNEEGKRGPTRSRRFKTYVFYSQAFILVFPQ
jgi:hypothetical protein